MTAAALTSGLLAGAAVVALLLRSPPGRLARVVPQRAAVRSGPATAGGQRPRRGAAGGQRPRRVASSRASPLAACLLAAGALLLLLPGAPGLVSAAVVALAGSRVLGRLEPAAVRHDRLLLRADLPLVLDLLGACLAGGAALPAAAAAVADAVGGPAGNRLAGVAAALAVGSPPGSAWLALAGPDPSGDPLGPAARALARAADGGAPVAAVIGRLAAEARADSRAEGEQAARRAGVLAVAPLGLCFLPAFVLLGVVPVVAGLAAPLLSAG